MKNLLAKFVGGSCLMGLLAAVVNLALLGAAICLVVWILRALGVLPQ